MSRASVRDIEDIIDQLIACFEELPVEELPAVKGSSLEPEAEKQLSSLSSSVS